MTAPDDLKVDEVVTVGTDPMHRDTDGGQELAPAPAVRSRKLVQVLAFGILPVVAIVLGCVAGGLKWLSTTEQGDGVAAADSVRAAAEATIALLSYRPDTAEQDLSAARERLTGEFRDSYTSLTQDVVIPGAREQQISAVATVPATASLLATENHAEVLLFVNQTTVIGTAAPTNTASVVKVTVERVDGRWLISKFEPV